MDIRLYAFAFLIITCDALIQAPRLWSSRTLAPRLALSNGVRDDTPSNHPEPARRVRRFYLLRHGQTDMNAAGIIQVLVCLFIHQMAGCRQTISSSNLCDHHFA